jgi:hypothetical protein
MKRRTLSSQVDSQQMENTKKEKRREERRALWCEYGR